MLEELRGESEGICPYRGEYGDGDFRDDGGVGSSCAIGV